MTSNFGPLNRDHFSHNIHIKGATVIDKYANINGNAINAITLEVTGNAFLGNIVSENLIVGNVITATDFIGKFTGTLWDEMGEQVISSQQNSITNPGNISSFIPGTNVDPNIVPQYSMPALGTTVIPTSSSIRQDSVEHLLYYNQLQLRNEVTQLRTQVIAILNALRSHGLIAQ